MSKQTSTTRPTPSINIETHFETLRAALNPLLSTLSAEQQAALLATIDQKINETHQAILEQIQANLVQSPATPISTEPTPLPETFDQKIYQQKLQSLLAYSSDITYQAAKNLPRDTEWVRTLEYFKNKSSQIFKMLFVNCDNKTTGQKHLQGLIVQEFDQYDKHACNKEIGEITLPIRFRHGKIEAAITIKNPPGTFGKAMFAAPRSSNSNTQKSAFLAIPKTLWTKYQRPDANRLTGKIRTNVIFLEEQIAEQIDTQQEKIIWFTIPELTQLLQEPPMEDAPTIALIQWVLLNASNLQEKFQVDSVQK